MASDLGSDTREVHAKAQEVLGFWFGLLMPEQHFAKSDSVDAAIRDRFADLRTEIVASDAAGWRDDPDTLLAAVIVIDQFSRNLFRDSGKAYAADPLALELTLLALDRGWDADMRQAHRQFLYMPLMHAEDRAIQALSLRKFEELDDPEVLGFAREHAAVIERFGRFPSRNDALGRESTPEEAEFIASGKAGW